MNLWVDLQLYHIQLTLWTTTSYHNGDYAFSEYPRRYWWFNDQIDDVKYQRQVVARECTWVIWA